jgi:2-oxoglutarate ferredoxin oxidoreductase subunit delta
VFGRTEHLARFEDIEIRRPAPGGVELMAYEHVVDRDRCKGCGLCVAVCPKNVLEIGKEMNPKGYFPACQARPEDCIFCAICCTMCPDVAITINAIAAEADGGAKRRS